MKHQHAKEPIQAVIFDLDGLLMNSEWLAYKVWSELVEQHGGILKEEDYARTIGISVEETAHSIRRCTGVQFDIGEACAWSWRRLEERLKTEIEPMPGSKELVQKLAALGYPLAIASNGLTRYIENALRGLDLLDYFPVRASIDQVAQGKPAPDVYLRAAEQLGITPRRCLAIDDSPAGVQSALAAGMRVIAVPSVPEHNGAFHAALMVCRSLIEINKALPEILA